MVQRESLAGHAARLTNFLYECQRLDYITARFASPRKATWSRQVSEYVQLLDSQQQSFASYNAALFLRDGNRFRRQSNGRSNNVTLTTRSNPASDQVSIPGKRGIQIRKSRSGIA